MRKDSDGGEEREREGEVQWTQCMGVGEIRERHVERDEIKSKGICVMEDTSCGFQCACRNRDRARGAVNVEGMYGIKGNKRRMPGKGDVTKSEEKGLLGRFEYVSDA